MKDPILKAELSQILRQRNTSNINNELFLFCSIIESTYQVRIYGDVKSVGGPNYQLLTKVEKSPQFQLASKAKKELLTCLFGARIAKNLAVIQELDIKNIYLWTDSLNAFHWIKNPSSRTELDVKCRVTEILNITKVHQWQYNNLENNPVIHIFNA